MRYLALAITLSLFAAAGCSNNKQYYWNDQMHIWFDNGAIADKTPRMQWTGAQQEVLLRRVGFADGAALGAIIHVGTYQRFDDELQVVISFRPSEIMHGKLRQYLDQDGELRLSLDNSAKDFRLALMNRKHLPGSRYLILLKRLPPRARADDDEGGWRASLRLPKPAGVPPFRWALYHADPVLISEVRRLYELQRTRDEDRDEGDADDEPKALDEEPPAPKPAAKPAPKPLSQNEA